MGRRAITPDDPRLAQIADMRSRGLKQVEMARALGASQQTISRLTQYIDSLTADQLAQVVREREPGTLGAMLRHQSERRAVMDRIYDAYHGDLTACEADRKAGHLGCVHSACDPETVAALWAQADAMERPTL